MLTQNNLREIKKIIEEFFKKTTFEVEIKFRPQKDYYPPSPPTTSGGGQAFPEEKRISTLAVDLKADEPQILIGEAGQTLAEIQHLLKAILKRKIKTREPFYLDLDINDYKKKKAEYLKDLACSLAEEVVLSQKEKILPPMSAFERRIIHLELAERKNVTTESIGQEPERRVVIRPYP